MDGTNTHSPRCPPVVFTDINWAYVFYGPLSSPGTSRNIIFKFWKLYQLCFSRAVGTIFCPFARSIASLIISQLDHGRSIYFLPSSYKIAKLSDSKRSRRQSAHLSNHFPPPIYVKSQLPSRRVVAEKLAENHRKLFEILPCNTEIGSDF